MTRQRDAVPLQLERDEDRCVEYDGSQGEVNMRRPERTPFALTASVPPIVKARVYPNVVSDFIDKSGQHGICNQGTGTKGCRRRMGGG